MRLGPTAASGEKRRAFLSGQLDQIGPERVNVFGAKKPAVRGPSSPKTESLRLVMLELMARAKFSHPEFWVPCALVGDGGR